MEVFKNIYRAMFKLVNDLSSVTPFQEEITIINASSKEFAS